MRFSRIVVALVVVVSSARTARAQTNVDVLSALQTAVACAVPPVLADPRQAGARVVGSQDTVPRMIFGPHDLIVISSGTTAGVSLGQRFFVRRPVTFGSTSPSSTHAVHTSGWIRIVAVNETTSIAAVDVSCSDISQNDYLEPFVVPVLPEGANRNDASGEPDFSTLGHILFGTDEYSTAGIGDFMLIDRGSDLGTELGVRFAVYRDLRVGGVPLTPIGEGIVVSVGRAMSVMRITAARDVVRTGDFVAPRKP